MWTMNKHPFRLARISNYSLLAVSLALLVPMAALAQGDRPNPARDTQRIRLNPQSQLELYMPVYRDRIQPVAGDRDVNPMGGDLPGSPWLTDRDYARVVPPVPEQQRSIQSPSPEFGVTQDGKACDIPPHIVPVPESDTESRAITAPDAEVKRPNAPEGARGGDAKVIQPAKERARGAATSENRPKTAPKKAKA
ncbi:hypothetical protein LLG95_15655 [bacterium]|nr:hypothetical protein [bacterium]